MATNWLGLSSSKDKIFCKVGKANANVFPDPVAAYPMNRLTSTSATTSLCFRNNGMVAA
jgi:hypothetical protein